MSDDLSLLLEQHGEVSDKIESMLKSKKRKIEKKKSELQELEMFSNFDTDLLGTFFNHPYLILPKGDKGERFVIVPKFIDISIGYLWRTTEAYNVFVVDWYAHYIGAVPREFEQIFKPKPTLPLTVFDGVLLTGEHQDAAMERYKPFLTRREGSDRIKIKKGMHFELIANLISDGILPFIPRPVDKAHYVKPVWNIEIPDIERRRNMKFFKDAIKTFYERGSVGLYWAMGVGKSIYGLEALASVKVGDLPNLVISGKSASLKQQWIDNLALIECAAPVEVITYLSYHKVKDRKFGLVIFDESHHLPANTFSRMSTLDCVYRIGLSATPYREDHKTEYIFALTGYPVGLNWQVLLDLDLIKAPDVFLVLCENYKQKQAKIAELLRQDEKTLIYCYTTDLGKELSERFEIPFVYGDTPVKERKKIIENSLVTIVSSVGKEGLSFKDVQRTITYNFHYGSTQEELQFLGRLLHGQKEKKGAHYILMTDEEEDRYGKRVWGITEKGFKIRPERFGGGTVPRPKQRKTKTPKPRATPRPKPVRSVATKPVVDTSKFPRLKELDDRDPFNDKMIFAILKTEYAKQGLEVDVIRRILELHNIKFEYRRLRDRCTSLYKQKTISGLKGADGKRRYFME